MRVTCTPPAGSQLPEKPANAWELRLFLCWAAAARVLGPRVQLLPTGPVVDMPPDSQKDPDTTVEATEKKVLLRSKCEELHLGILEMGKINMGLKALEEAQKQNLPKQKPEGSERKKVSQLQP